MTPVKAREHVRVKWLAYDIAKLEEGEPRMKLIGEYETHHEAHEACLGYLLTAVLHVEIQMPFRRHNYRPPPPRAYRSPGRHGEKWWDKD